MSKGSRNYCFTVNNYTRLLDPELWGNKILFCVFSEEIGDSGTIHLQGFMQLARAYTMKQLHVWEGLENAALLCARGNAEENIAYICHTGKHSDKEGLLGGPYIFGHPVAAKVPPNWAQLWLDVQARVPERDLYNAHPSIMLPHGHKLAQWMAVAGVTPLRSWKTSFIVIWGPSRSGKTEWVKRNYPDAYVKADRTKWWPGYKGQEVVVINEMRGSFFEFRHLLTFADPTGMEVENKGGSQPFLATTFIFTCNTHLSKWYSPEVMECRWGPENPLYERIMEGDFMVMPSRIHGHMGYEYGTPVSNKAALAINAFEIMMPPSRRLPQLFTGYNEPGENPGLSQ